MTWTKVGNIKGATGATGSQGLQGVTGPGVAPGGATGQVLSKIDATDYNTQWVSGGLTLPLSENLTFNPDSTYDIGASGETRPRDLFLGRNLTVGGTVTVPNGSIAGVAIATGGITTTQIADGTIAAGDMAAGAAASNVGTLGGALTGTLPNPGLAALPANSVGASQITDGSVGSAELAAGAAATNVGTLGGVLGGTLPNPTMAAGAAATNVGTLGGSLSGTLPNPTLAANSVGASQITDGTVGTAELANNAVTNAKLASDVARLNLLVNGGFEIWQRGTSFPTAGSGTWTADGWAGQGQTSSRTLIVARETTIIDAGSATAMKITTAAGTSASDKQGMCARLEHPQMSGRTFTLAVSARSDTGTLNAYLFYWDGAFTFASPVTLTTTYQRFTYTFTYSGAAGPYVGVVIDSAGTFYLDNATLVAGTVPMDYVPLHPADEWTRCLRYCEVMTFKNGQIMFTGVSTSAIGAGQYFPFKMVKYATPTMTHNAGQWINQRCDTAGQQSAGPTYYGTTAYGTNVSSTGAVGAGIAFTFYPNTTDGTITAESNP